MFTVVLPHWAKYRQYELISTSSARDKCITTPNWEALHAAGKRSKENNVIYSKTFTNLFFSLSSTFLFSLAKIIFRMVSGGLISV